MNTFLTAVDSFLLLILFQTLFSSIKFMPKTYQQSSDNESIKAKLQQNLDESQKQQSDNSKQEKSKSIKKRDKNKGKELTDQQIQQPQDIENQDSLQEINQNQKIEEGQAFMDAQERQIDKHHPRYHFCRFISRHYRLIEDKKDRKHHFVRMQPVFVRFLHVLKLHNLPLVTIDTFRKYFKKFFKRRGIKYEQTTNRVDMKVVVGIDRRYNSKFQF